MINSRIFNSNTRTSADVTTLINRSGLSVTKRTYLHQLIEDADINLNAICVILFDAIKFSRL